MALSDDDSKSTSEDHQSAQIADRRSVVLVINQRFIPDSKDGAFVYGAVQHTLRIASLLALQNTAVSFCLYRRVDELSQPELSQTEVFGYPAVAVKFDFKISPRSVKMAFAEAIRVLGDSPMRPILYLQSISVADLLPESLPVVITNHSPFVQAVNNAIGPELTRLAFNWDHPKESFLLQRQREALEWVLHRSNITFAEISRLQIDYLSELGIDNKRVYAMPPPVGRPTSILPRLLPYALSRLTDELEPRIAMLAVSRFDAFKDLNLFADGAAMAIASGSVDFAVLIGGESKDQNVREVTQSLSASLQSRFIHLPRQRHDVLTEAVFPWVARRGIVACTSRYDLVPYTILEAVVAGAPVVVPDSPYVGAGDHVPSSWRYRRNARSLADALSSRPEAADVVRVQSRIRSLTADINVAAALESAMSAAWAALD